MEQRQQQLQPQAMPQQLLQLQQLVIQRQQQLLPQLLAQMQQVLLPLQLPQQGVDQARTALQLQVQLLLVPMLLLQQLPLLWPLHQVCITSSLQVTIPSVAFTYVVCMALQPSQANCVLCYNKEGHQQGLTAHSTHLLADR